MRVLPVGRLGVGEIGRGNAILDSPSFESITLPALLVLSFSIFRRLFLIKNAGHFPLSSSSPMDDGGNRSAVSESLEEIEELFIVRRILHRLHIVSGDMGAVFHLYDLRPSYAR